MSETLPSPITTLTASQRTQILNLIRRAARAEILPRFRALSPDQIASKSDSQDLVTAADVAAEAMIARGLARMFPGALIVGEEATAADPGLRDKIDEAETAFAIDPVDGTWNFATGLSTFGVMLAMTRFGRPVFGLLYDPLNDDVIWSAEGEHAVLQSPRRAARVLQTSDGGKVEDVTGCIPLFMIPPALRGAVAATLPGFRRVLSLRCSCHEYRMLAQGHIDFVLSAGLTPWDHAPGALIVARAGGHVAMINGDPFTAGTKKGYLLAAANAETWGRVRDALTMLIDTDQPWAAPKQDGPDHD